MICPTFRFRSLKWLLKKDRFCAYKYKWEDPSGHSRSPAVVRRTVDLGVVSIGIKHLNR